MKYSGWSIFSDYDGTLVTSGFEGPSEENTRALQYFLDNGGRFGIASGRLKVEIDHGLDGQIKANLPGIYSNGAIIQDSVNGDVLYERPLPPNYRDFIKTVFSLYPDLTVYLAAQNKLHILNGLERTQEELEDVRRSIYGMKDVPLQEVAAQVQQQRAWDELTSLEQVQGTCYKIMLMGSAQRIAAAKKTMSAFDRENQYKILSSFPFNSEIVSAAAGKGTALNWLVEHQSLGKVIALGDGENDVGMFRAAAYSVAPANAQPFVKAQATLVCAPGEEIIPKVLRFLEG